MRALITFIAILTVGIVTAQDNPDTYRGNISYNHVDETISVPNVGEGATTYTIVGDMHRNLNHTYPEGSDHIYHYKREIDLITNHLIHWEFGEAAGVVAGDGHQGYRLLARVDDGSGAQNLSFPADIPHEEVNNGRFSATINTNRGTTTDRYAYNVVSRLTMQNTAGFSQANAQVNLSLRFVVPELYHQTFSDLIFFQTGFVYTEISQVDLPNIAGAGFNPATILTATDNDRYVNREPHETTSVELFHGEGGHVGRLSGGRAFPVFFNYRANDIR